MTKRMAFAYLRVSSVGRKDGDGFPRQRQVIAAFVNKARMKLVGEYKDTLAGTTNAAARPAFEAMIAEMLTDGVRIVIVERLDRLAREYRIQEELALYLAGHGIALWSADTGENITEAMLGDPMKKALVQMRGVFAELDKSVLVKKLRAGRERKRRETGRCEGRKPFGSRPGEQRIVERIRQLRRKPRKRERRSFAKIAAQLNAEGLPTRQGGPWKPGSVQAIWKRVRGA